MKNSAIILEGSSANAESWQLLLQLSPTEELKKKRLVRFGFAEYGSSAKNLYDSIESLVSLTVAMCVHRICDMELLRKIQEIARFEMKISEQLFKLFKFKTIGLFVMARLEEICNDDFLDKVAKKVKRERAAYTRKCCLFGVVAETTGFDEYEDMSTSTVFAKSKLSKLLDEALQSIEEVKRLKLYEKTIASLQKYLSSRSQPFWKRMKLMRGYHAQSKRTGKNVRPSGLDNQND